VIRLCSASTTRAKILKDAKIDFIQTPVEFDEDSIKIDNPRGFVYYASKGKLESAKALYGLDTPLLVADTVVSDSKGQILRKAKSKDEARAFLELQSGSSISIITCAHYQSNTLYFLDLSSTYYKFAPFNKEHLEEYLESNKWQGKAGACMVEDFCKEYILEVKGLKSTAMGLQIEIIRPWIED